MYQVHLLSRAIGGEGVPCTLAWQPIVYARSVFPYQTGAHICVQ